VKLMAMEFRAIARSERQHPDAKILSLGNQPRSDAAIVKIAYELTRQFRRKTGGNRNVCCHKFLISPTGSNGAQPRGTTIAIDHMLIRTPFSMLSIQIISWNQGMWGIN
jgi:hypothetical protein